MQLQILPDPRDKQKKSLLSEVPEHFHPLYQEIEQYLVAPTQDEKDRHAQKVYSLLTEALLEQCLPSLDNLLADAPSVENARVLSRLIQIWECVHPEEGQLGIQFFAWPLIFVVAAERPLTLRGVLSKRESIEALWQEKRVLGNAEQWGISNALCTPEALVGPVWGDWMQQQVQGLEGGLKSLQRVPPSDIHIKEVNQEQVFLRFLVGAAVISSKTTWQAGAAIETWGMAAAENLSQQMAMPGSTVLVLPRTPKTFTQAIQEGKRLQREVSLQLFISNAVRNCRTKFGEPSVVLSAHVMENGSGEVRVSISSTFSAKDAQGFRCPLFDDERIGDVQRMVQSFLEECQIRDVRILQKVYPDKEDETGLTLLFKPEAIPDDELIF